LIAEWLLNDSEVILLPDVFYHNLYIILSSHDEGKTWDYDGYRFWEKWADAISEREYREKNMAFACGNTVAVKYRILRFKPNGY
jgi:hypothetical protein